MSDILEDNALLIKKRPLGISERHTVLFDVYGVFRIIPLECTLRHNANMISNHPSSWQYEDMVIYPYQFTRTKIAQGLYRFPPARVSAQLR